MHGNPELYDFFVCCENTPVFNIIHIDDGA